MQKPEKFTNKKARNEEFDRKKIHPLQRAWAAGVLDSRVTIPITGYLVHFDSTDEHLVNRMADTLGIGKAWCRKHSQVKGSIWRYETQNMDTTRDLLLMASPFLSATKLQQAGVMIGRIEQNPRWRKKNPEKVPSQDNT